VGGGGSLADSTIWLFDKFDQVRRLLEHTLSSFSHKKKRTARATHPKMPLFNLQVSNTLDEAKIDDVFLTDLSSLLAQLLGKPELVR
jgi:hypothetical protein